jgi:dipeptidase E
MTNATKILLLSSSRVENMGFLDHALSSVVTVLGGVTELIFVPYALADWSGYTATVADSLQRVGVSVRGLHTFDDPSRALAEGKAVFVGGGNTFRLLSSLEGAGVLPVLAERAGRGLVYIGSSAGTNLACPTIRTTNDMPIVQPESFTALGVVPFQINPHFVGGGLLPGHRGETREERIAQFHEVADTPVIGLPEACWLEVDRSATVTRTTVRGDAAAVMFRRGRPAQTLPAGTELRGVAIFDQSRPLRSH